MSSMYTPLVKKQKTTPFSLPSTVNLAPPPETPAQDTSPVIPTKPTQTISEPSSQRPYSSDLSLSAQPEMGIGSTLSTRATGFKIPNMVELQQTGRELKKTASDVWTEYNKEQERQTQKMVKGFKQPFSKEMAERMNVEFDPEAAKLAQEANMNVVMGIAEEGAVPFKGFKDLSTKILEKLKGKTTVSKQFIQDLTNSGDVKQAERDVLRSVLEKHPEKVNVSNFADQVKDELLPLSRVTRNPAMNRSAARYENITLPDELRGDVADYTENIYESPIKTSAGDVHFAQDYAPTRGADLEPPRGYFGHTRVEDMADGSTRRVIEAQSDLYQKGGLDREYTGEATGKFSEQMVKDNPNLANVNERASKRRSELSKLAQYNDPTAHYRMIREEVKRAAEDGKTKLQLPTGETAMKIEGLGSSEEFVRPPSTKEEALQSEIQRSIKPEDLKVGMEIKRPGVYYRFVVTDVLGEGKFKAVPKDKLKMEHPAKLKGMNGVQTEYPINHPMVSQFIETFDISGKMNKENPIYKFYEKEVGKYVKNKYGAKLVTDLQGVTWWEMDIKPEHGINPVEAFAMAPLGLAGVSEADKKKNKKK